MPRFSHVIWLGLMLLGLSACGARPAPTPSPPAKPVAPRDSLSRIVERYWDENASLGDPISPQSMADSLAVERRYLAEALAVPRTSLDADSRLTYDIFIRQRELAIEGFRYPTELLPVNPFGDMPQQFARLAAATEQHPFSSVKDYENWLLRIDDYALWTQQAISNMRAGIRRGYTLPRVLVERTLPSLQREGEDTSGNVFYIPLRTLPATIKEPERTRLAMSLSVAIKDRLLPAYRALHDFLQSEYLPRARVSLALSALPLGDSWYAYRLKRATGTSLTPNEIYGIGVAEVERLRIRIQPLLAGVPLADIAKSPSTKDGAELLNDYKNLEAQTVAAMPTLFSASPPSDFEIRAAAPWQEAAAPLSYLPAAPGGATPAILYVNTGTVAARAAGVVVSSFLQEALPGHHYQSALQEQRADLPRFRRFGGEPAFVDGWGLYAASLGEELGLYGDDAAKLGALMGQMTCAVALVVDTGLQAKGWTHAQAFEYLRAQLAMDEADANLLTDRYVALPGDALACKMGELKIQALRARAQQALGGRFDIREFHSEILKDGAMPLDILEAKMNTWMQAPR